MKIKIFISLFLLCAMLSCGPASVKYTIISPDTTYTITLDSTKFTGKDTIVYTVQDNSKPTQIVVQKDGFKSYYEAIFTKLDSANVYKKKYYVKQLEPFPKWTPEYKHFVVKQEEMKSTLSESLVEYYTFAKYFRGGEPTFKDKYTREKSYSLLKDIRLNEVLEKRGFVDTNRVLLLDNLNTVVLDCSIAYSNMKLIYQIYANTWLPELIIDSIGMDWYMENVFGDTLMTKRIYTQSSLHKGSQMLLHSSINIINEVTEKSFLQLLQSKDVEAVLKKDTSVEAMLKPITIQKPTRTPKDADEAVQACVTIKTKSGEGSGFIISHDGYIITNYNVIAQKGDQFTVVTSDGRQYNADLIRINRKTALALLKVRSLFDIAFVFPNDFSGKPGDEVLAVSTQTGAQFSQSITKGVVSAFREVDGSQYLQIDASMSKTSAGAPIFHKDMSLVGIANFKLSGIGLEGLSFAIPADKISKELKLTYSAE